MGSTCSRDALARVRRFAAPIVVFAGLVATVATSGRVHALQADSRLASITESGGMR